MSKYSILLLKDNTSSLKDETTSSPADYETILSEFNCKIYFIPPLQFDFLNIELLLSRILHPEKYSGIILTSPRSVNACHQAFKQIEKDQNIIIWRKNKICYTVGPSTSTKVTQDLKWAPNNIRGGERCGNAHSLAELIIEDFKDESLGLETKGLLYPCGNLKRETIAKELEDRSNIDLDTITCYETSPNKDLDANFMKLLKETSHIDIVVFFSPSGVKTCWELLQKCTSNSSKYIAIGPTTLESLKSYCNDHDKLFQSKSPSPSGVKDIVAQVIANQ